MIFFDEVRLTVLLPKYKAKKLEKVKCPKDKKEETRKSLVFHTDDKKG